MKEEFIKVLWVENDPEVIESYPIEAEQFGLHLMPFTNWDDAEAALKKDIEQWSAIILDAKCCVHSDSPDNAAAFLTRAQSSISALCAGKQFIPWYVLSGQAEENIKDSILESRKEWDGDWEKAYYDKNTDREELYRRIRYQAPKFQSSCLKIHEMYKKVFLAIDNLKLHDDVDNYLTDLLVEIHFPELDDKDYNDKYKKVRQIVELIFRSMIDRGLLPPQKKINLKCSNLILSGYPVFFGRDENKILVVDVNSAVFPKIIQDNMIHMIHTAGSDVHTEAINDDDTKHIHEYLGRVGNTSYLLKSYALQLCDVILWYQDYITNHPDEEINALNWDIVDSDNLSQVFR